MWISEDGVTHPSSNDPFEGWGLKHMLHCAACQGQMWVKDFIRYQGFASHANCDGECEGPFEAVPVKDGENPYARR